MQDIYNLIIGTVFLVLGIPMGKLLAKITKEELRQGRKYFIILIILSLIGVVVFLIWRNDALFFTFLFIVIVTMISLVAKNK